MREDGVVNPEDLRVCASAFRLNWKCREAGIPYYLVEEREFRSMALNYQSIVGKTGYIA